MVQAALQALRLLLTRILEDQHSALRTDILQTHRDFAKQVAGEVYEQQRADQLQEAENRPRRFEGPILPMLTGALTVIVVLVGGLFLQARSERDGLRDELDRVVATAEQERISSLALAEQMQSSISDVQGRSNRAMEELLRTLTWAINQASTVPYGELPFNESRTELISVLVSQLKNAGFQGIVQIESHLGEFCLQSDVTGVYQLVEPTSAIDNCGFIGHPLDDSKSLTDRQSPHFATFVAGSPLVNGSGIELDIIVRDRSDSIPSVQYPAEPVSASDWNRAAAQNNRLEFTLLARTYR